MILVLALYVALVSDILPHLFLKLRCVMRGNLGRGLKKCVFPTGRSVLYEPHPSIRKYINKYLLFTSDGYKYVRCCFDCGVNKISYTVVMLNNNDKVIDVISVTEDVKRHGASANVMLHPDTSYVAVTVSRVNGLVNKKISVYNKVSGLIGYFIAVSAASISAILVTRAILPELVYRTFGSEMESSIGVAKIIVFGFLISAAVTVLYLIGAARKGIRVIVNEEE